jgi:hypothetical protein
VFVNIILQIRQTSDYNGRLGEYLYIHACRYVPAIYEILKVRIGTFKSSIGDIFSQNQFYHISQKKYANYVCLHDIEHRLSRNVSTTLNVFILYNLRLTKYRTNVSALR